MFDRESEIRSNAAKFGADYYGRTTTYADEFIKELFETIDDLRDQIRELRKRTGMDEEPWDGFRGVPQTPSGYEND